MTPQITKMVPDEAPITILIKREIAASVVIDEVLFYQYSSTCFQIAIIQ